MALCCRVGGGGGRGGGGSVVAFTDAVAQRRQVAVALPRTDSGRLTTDGHRVVTHNRRFPAQTRRLSDRGEGAACPSSLFHRRTISNKTSQTRLGWAAGGGGGRGPFPLGACSAPPQKSVASLPQPLTQRKAETHKAGPCSHLDGTQTKSVCTRGSEKFSEPPTAHRKQTTSISQAVA